MPIVLALCDEEEVSIPDIRVQSTIWVCCRLNQPATKLALNCCRRSAQCLLHLNCRCCYRLSMSVQADGLQESRHAAVVAHGQGCAENLEQAAHAHLLFGRWKRSFVFMLKTHMSPAEVPVPVKAKRGLRSLRGRRTGEEAETSRDRCLCGCYTAACCLLSGSLQPQGRRCASAEGRMAETLEMSIDSHSFELVSVLGVLVLCCMASLPSEYDIDLSPGFTGFTHAVHSSHTVQTLPQTKLLIILLGPRAACRSS